MLAKILQNPIGTFRELCVKLTNCLLYFFYLGRGVVYIPCLLQLMLKYIPISDLGHSRSVLPVYRGAQSQRNRRRHRCLLVLRRAEIALHCGRQHDCALPEDEVVSCTSAPHLWQNPRILLRWTISGMMAFGRFSKRQKITDDSEDCLFQRMHSALSPCRHAILHFLFFCRGMTALHLFISIFYSFCLFPVEGRGFAAAWQFLIMSP